MTHTISVFSLDVGGSERLLRRTAIADEAVDGFVTAPVEALTAMLPVGGTRPDGFRITDARGHVRVAHTRPRRLRA